MAASEVAAALVAAARAAAISSLARFAYISTYSWPESAISSYMIWSVTERSTNRSSAISA